MPPNSTQNLNAKLSAPGEGSSHQGGAPISLESAPIHSSAPPVRIVGATSSYHGGYHLSV